jgi:hypothetical protein
VRLTHPFYNTRFEGEVNTEADPVVPDGSRGYWWHESLRALASIPEWVLGSHRALLNDVRMLTGIYVFFLCYQLGFHWLYCVSVHLMDRNNYGEWVSQDCPHLAPLSAARLSLSPIVFFLVVLSHHTPCPIVYSRIITGRVYQFTEDEMKYMCVHHCSTSTVLSIFAFRHELSHSHLFMFLSTPFFLLKRTFVPVDLSL